MADAHSNPSSPAVISFRARTASTPARPKGSDDVAVETSWTATRENHRDKSASESASRARRPVSTATTSSSTFSIPKAFSISSSLNLFSKRRKASVRAPPNPSNPSHPSHPPRASGQKDEVLGDVIEIGPDRPSRDENNEEAERERLRDAAALALGLGLGREEQAEMDGDGEDEVQPTPVPEQPTQPHVHTPVSDQTTQQYIITPVSEKSMQPYVHTPVSEKTTHPYVHSPVSEHAAQPFIHAPIPRVPPLLEPSPAPPSFISLSQRLPSPSIATSFHSSDTIPPYPSALSALTPYIQNRTDLLRYHPAGTFLAISLSRRTKQWRPRHVILTAPLPSPLALANADILSITGHRRANGHAAPQHAHLHLFKNASPAIDEVEIDRLEINEDSVVFIAENEIAGRRDIVKVGGRDARGDGAMSAGVSIKSVPRSWHSGGTAALEQSIEEMGRTMWLLKMSDGDETQRWIGFIKTAVLVQRAERAGMTFHPNGSSNGVSSMRADLDGSLSIRSHGHPPSIAPPRAEAPPYSSPPPIVSGTTNRPVPNPRFADHVGAAPSRSSPQSTLRARTYPSPSTALTLQSFKGLFNSAPQSNPNSPPPSPLQQVEMHENIDPIAEESGSLGTRATALLNIFRSSSRASHTNHARASGPHVRMQSPSPTPASRIHDIGILITSGPIAEEPAQNPGTPAETFSVDWSMMQGSKGNGNAAELSAPGRQTSSLPPPPRNHRRPWTSGDIPRQGQDTLTNGKTEKSETEESSSRPGSLTPTPPLSPLLLSSPSLNASSRRPHSATSTLSYASVERDHLSDQRRTSRVVPKKLAPPTGPPPSAPSVRDYSPSFDDPPSPIFEQSHLHQNGNGRLEQPQPIAPWGTQNHPYSKRVSSSPARSVNTVSTGHSFIATKSPPPPPRPPPTFAPPPVPQAEQPDTSSAKNHSPRRESFLPRPLRLSLLPPAAPPTHPPPPRPPSHPPPPRPDDPGYRHRRSSSSDTKPSSKHFSISSLRAPALLLTQHPPAAPPPSGPLPPIPVSDSEKDAAAVLSYRSPSLTQRLRILSAPVMSSDQATLLRNELSVRRSLDKPSPIGEPILLHREDSLMFLNMNDTPITPAVGHSHSFLHVSSPLHTSTDDVQSTSLSPPPRRNSRTSKEIHRTPISERDETKSPVNGDPPPEPRDSAVIIEQN